MLITIFIIITLIQLSYMLIMISYLYGWMRTKEYNINNYFNNFYTKVSVIIPARNEEKNICSILEDVANQDYPKFLYEIIVVDDNSNDKTFNEIKQFIENNTYTNIRVLSLNDYNISGKKNAITKAISVSEGDLIVTTDADCKVNRKWLSSLVSFYQENNYRMIIGPVALYNELNLFQIIQSIELIGLIGATCGAVFYKKPIMCNGANLIYEKKIFYEVEGYNLNNNIASGDDVFLMHKISKKNKNNIGFIKSYDAMVFTMPLRNINEFINQRKRWSSKAKKYNDIWTIFIATNVYLVNLLGLLVIIYAFINLNAWLFCFIIFFIKSVTDYIVLKKFSFFFKKNKLLKYFILSELFNILYVSLIGIIGNISHYKWKDKIQR